MTHRPLFLITMDTEGDNLWSRPRLATTHNADFLPRFQTLAEQHGLRPTWLVDQDMLSSPRMISFGRDVLARGAGEIGMHPHAWNTPPLIPVTPDDFNTQPFITSHPEDVIFDKINHLATQLEEAFESPITSHRGGRWALDARYARALVARGITVDCTVTPGLRWRDATGTVTDHTSCGIHPYRVDLDAPSRAGQSDLIEIPMSIVPRPSPHAGQWMRLLGPPGQRLARRLCPDHIWMRPSGWNRRDLLELLESAVENKWPCLEFMLHSSELMPGGSPRFRTRRSIERLYNDLQVLFRAAETSCVGATLTEAARQLSPHNTSAADPATPEIAHS